MDEEFSLIEPSIEYMREIEAYRREFMHPGASMDGGGRLIHFDDIGEWLKRVKACKRWETVPEGEVPTAQYIYFRHRDRKVVGVIQIRLYLNDYLEKYAGHIGYSVAPSERQRGYATRMLALALPKCRQFGIHRLMISCVSGNEASRKTILKNGGVYESTVYEPGKDRYLERYIIALDR